MPTIGSRDLRNHGKPVAELRQLSRQRRPGVPRHELIALLERQTADTTLADDLAWITDGTTAELGDPARPGDSH